MPFESELICNFTDGELRTIRAVAQKRTDWFNAQNGFRHIAGEAQSLENNITGVMGELAACRWFDADPAPILNFTPGPDGGVDVVAPGIIVQVKASQYREPELVIPPLQLERINPRAIYVLVGTRNFRSVWPGGYCWGSSYLARSHQRDFQKGIGPQPVVHHEKLDPLSSFLNPFSSLTL